jgi:hypothetical protein
MGELDLARTLRRGDRGNKVRAVQEWISLNGIGLVTDGQFGPATEFAIKTFQKERGLAKSGIVGQSTFSELVAPMRQAVVGRAPEPTLGATVVAYAKQHLERQPREVGGQNRGPWVRLYMGGNEGEPWPWCAGFVCYVLKQACRAFGVPMPIRASFSCDSLAASAQEKGRFLPERTLDRTDVRPGMLFLNPRTSADWTHVGIVVDVSSIGQDVFLSIEGNTNDSGDREGYEVCRRIRSFRGKDFIRVD